MFKKTQNYVSAKLAEDIRQAISWVILALLNEKKWGTVKAMLNYSRVVFTVNICKEVDGLKGFCCFKAWGKCLEHLEKVWWQYRVWRLEDNFQLGQGLESCGSKCLSVSDADALLPPLSDEPSLWTDVINNAALCTHWLQSPWCELRVYP